MSKTKKVSRKKTSTSRALKVDETLSLESPATFEMPTTTRQRKPFLKIGLVVVLLVVAGALVMRNKSQFIVASVNGKPVFRSELNTRLSQRYGSSVLEAIIGERLITEAATKAGVSISSEELAVRISEIEKSLNGSMKLEDALKMQGVSKEEFESQVRIQGLIDELLAKEVSVSAQEVDEYLKNAPAVSASEAAARRLDAEKELKNNKIGEKFQEWFAKIKEAAKVQRYL